MQQLQRPLTCKSHAALTSCGHITVPLISTLEVDKADRGCSKLDKAQVHENVG